MAPQLRPDWAARAGELDAADRAYERAIGLESAPAVRRFLQHRRDALHDRAH
jgi:RNA polymerase sigma-70 factor (ECF subfamily)